MNLHDHEMRKDAKYRRKRSDRHEGAYLGTQRGAFIKSDCVCLGLEGGNFNVDVGKAAELMVDHEYIVRMEELLLSSDNGWTELSASSSP